MDNESTLKQSWVYLPENCYQMVRWYWQGYTTSEIRYAVEADNNTVIKAIRQFTPTNRKASRKRDDPEHRREAILNRILKKYGPEVYDMWISYLNNSNRSYTEELKIAAAMGICYEAVRKRIAIITNNRREPRRNYEKLDSQSLSNSILSKYGPNIHKIVMNYPNDPMTTTTDIAELLEISKTAAGTKLRLLHGNYFYNKPMMHKYCECKQYAEQEFK